MLQPHRAPTTPKRSTEEVVKTSQSNGSLANGRKFMLTLRESVFSELQKSADQRGVTVQGLIRAVIVPEWHLEHEKVLGSSIPQSYNSSQEELQRESVAMSIWPKTRKNIAENPPNRIVAD